MLAAPEIAWKAFVLVISVLPHRVVCRGWCWQGEKVLQSSMRLQGPKGWPRPGDHPPISLCHVSPCKPMLRVIFA